LEASRMTRDSERGALLDGFLAAGVAGSR